MNLRGSLVWMNVVVKYSPGDYELYCYERLVGSESFSGGDRSSPMTLRYEISETVGTHKQAEEALKDKAFLLKKLGYPVDPSVIESMYLDDGDDVVALSTALN